MDYIRQTNERHIRDILDKIVMWSLDQNNQINTVSDIGYIPKPNTVFTFKCDHIAPTNLTPTAFCIPIMFANDGDEENVPFVWLAINKRRGIELSGGHVDPGETPIMAARREATEEVGVIVDSLIPFAIKYHVSSAPNAPENYGYPFPSSFMQFFAAKVTKVLDFEVNDECDLPVAIRLDDDGNMVARNAVDRDFIDQISERVGAADLIKLAYRKVVED